MTKVPPLSFRREDLPDLSTGERTDKLLRGLNAFGAGAETLLNGGLSLTGNCKVFAKEIKLTTQADWATLSVTAPWTAAAVTPQIRKVGAHVEIRGQVTRNTATSGSTATTLAAQYRSTAWKRLMVEAGGVEQASLIVSPEDGTVAILYTGTPATISLDGARWDAVDATGGANPAFPVRIKNELPEDPAHVWVTRAVDVTDGRETPVALGGVAWSLSKDQIVIRDVANLLAGRKYRFTILVAAE